MSNLIDQTAKFSLIIQILTGLVGINGLRVKLDKKDKVLQDVLEMETVVQFVELVFYIWLLKSLKTVNNDTIASTRYIDWFITTPIMLISTVLYMQYNNYKKDDSIYQMEKLSLSSFWEENKDSLLKIIFLNALMLLFGYLGEVNKLPKVWSIGIGSLFFLINFKYIHQNYVLKNEENKNLFGILIFVWALYGVAAIMPVVRKNVMYNLLDLVSKNFYGLYIYYKIMELN